MEKVYIVYEHSEDKVHVVGIFTDKEKANKATLYEENITKSQYTLQEVMLNQMIVNYA